MSMVDGVKPTIIKPSSESVSGPSKVSNLGQSFNSSSSRTSQVGSASAPADSSLGAPVSSLFNAENSAFGQLGIAKFSLTAFGNLFEGTEAQKQAANVSNGEYAKGESNNSGTGAGAATVANSEAGTTSDGSDVQRTTSGTTAGGQQQVNQQVAAALQAGENKAVGGANGVGAAGGVNGANGAAAVGAPNRGVAGMGNSTPFGGQWQDFGGYNGYWADKGGYISQDGDYIDPNVMFKVHEKENAQMSEKEFNEANMMAGFLHKAKEDQEGEFAGRNTMDEMVVEAQSRAKEAGLDDLAGKGYEMAFIGAHNISVEDLKGDVGKMLKFDHAFKEAGRGKRSTAMERGLHQEMHKITDKALSEAIKLEGANETHVRENLNSLGHYATQKQDEDGQTREAQLSTVNYRALLETSKNLDLISDTDKFAQKVKDHFDEHGFLPKFNVVVDHTMDAWKGDSMAFANADLGLEHGQKSALKGLGGVDDIKFSEDANANNTLYFSTGSEKGLEEVQAKLTEAFEAAGLTKDQIMDTFKEMAGGDEAKLAALETAAENGVVSQWEDNVHSHGGENGTSMNEAGVVSSSTGEQTAEMDENRLDLGNAQGDGKTIMKARAEFLAENGADRYLLNMDSCHGDRQGKEATSRLGEHLARYDRANGTSSEMEITSRGVDTFGTADAQARGDKNGYIANKYDATGGVNTEFVYSSDRRVGGQGETKDRTDHYDGSGKFSKDESYQNDAREAFLGSVAEQTDRMRDYLAEADQSLAQHQEAENETLVSTDSEKAASASTTATTKAAASTWEDYNATEAASGLVDSESLSSTEDIAASSQELGEARDDITSSTGSADEASSSESASGTDSSTGDSAPSTDDIAANDSADSGSNDDNKPDDNKDKDAFVV